MHLVDESLAKVLLDDIDATTHSHILSIRRYSGAGEGGFDALGHKMEGGAALHHQRCARVVRQDEDGNVIDRVLAPPTPP